MISWLPSLISVIVGILSELNAAEWVSQHPSLAIAIGTIGSIITALTKSPIGSSDTKPSGRLFFIPIMLAWLVVAAPASALELAWDRNQEPDVTAYNVYGCFTAGCTVTRTPGQLQATVTQPAVGVIPVWIIPAGREGKLAVTARDSMNESGLSVPVPFDALAPPIPANPRILP